MTQAPEEPGGTGELALDADEQRHEIIAMQAHQGSVQPNSFGLSEAPCTIGRHRQCTIVIDNKDVSRRHATITFARPYYYLTDEGSTNGTFVNGERLHAPHALRAGDRIGFGSAEPILQFHDPDQTNRRAGGLRFDSQARRFYLGMSALLLTPSQHKLLLHLYEQAGALCTYESCAQAVWGRDYTPGLDASALEQTVHGVRDCLVEVILQEHGAATDQPHARQTAQVFVREKVLSTQKKQGYLLRQDAIERFRL